MLIHPWDAAADNTEWERWLREGHDFGQLVVNGPPGQPPHVVPTHWPRPPEKHCCTKGRTSATPTSPPRCLPPRTPATADARVPQPAAQAEQRPARQP